MLVLRITVNQHDESVGITENGDELEEKTRDDCSENGAPQTQKIVHYPAPLRNLCDALRIAR
jgi:hypothetical protein